MSKTRTWNGLTASELAAREGQLQRDGYSLAATIHEHDLKPRQYLKRSYAGSATSFEGPTKWCVICRES